MSSDTHKKIALIYIAEPYQCYHSASVASLLSSYPNCSVTEYYSFKDSAEHIIKVNDMFKESRNLTTKPLKKSFFTKLLHSLRFLDTEKNFVLKDNIDALNEYDAIIATEYTVAMLKKFGITKPKIMMISHGAGDRKVYDEFLAKDFDYFLFPGPKTQDFLLENGFSTRETSIITGSPKLDVLEKMREKNIPLFDNDKDIVLYNPHYKKSRSSYYKWSKKVISSFKNQNDFNLIVAPHVKMFHEGYFINEFLLNRQKSHNVIIDTGSEKSIDSTYTNASSIYMGDVSSQVYEFIIRPRPCVFLNPHKLNWKDNRYFKSWTFGEVVEHEDDIMPAVKRAHEKHHLYKDAQLQMIKESFGDLPLLGASKRTADAILEYLDDHH